MNLLSFLNEASYMKSMDTPVLIVGGGPVGMLAALMLAKQGVENVLIERQQQRNDAPKAHVINARTLEILHRLGIDAQSVREAGASSASAGDVRFMSSLTGTEVGSLPFERQGESATVDTPFPLVNIAQPILESLILGHVLESGLIDFRQGVTAEATRQVEDRVVVSLDNGESITARYVIAADGAGSRTRTGLGIEMDGPEVLQNYLMIHFRGDLSNETADHPGVLYFCLHPRHSGTFIAYDRASNWVLMHGYNPDHEKVEDFTDDVCRELISRSAGKSVEGIEVLHKSPWKMSAQIATRYREGDTFLVGDAAHRFPPTGGLGLNTGVGDVQNLTWKLAHVLKGKASASLLESYESERRQVAQINSAQSLQNAAKIFELFTALYGPEPDKSAEHFDLICENPSAFPEVREAVEKQRPHFDSINLQLGYRYGVQLQPDDVAVSCYEHFYDEGYYLPHSPVAEGWLLGLLDDGAYSLVTGPAGEVWQEAGVDLVVEDRDFSAEYTPWHVAAGLDESGALLVRPDGHIAARFEAFSASGITAAKDTINRISAGDR